MGKKNFDISSYILNSDDKELNTDEPEEKKEVNYWRSFSELHNDPAFLDAKKHEFSIEAEQAPDIKKMSGVSRRKFLALMSASAALAAAGCSNFRDKGEIIPYNNQPEGVVIGEANYFASTFAENGVDYGVLVKTREGRPIKIDGNPDHPVSKGKINSRIQASILSLYDPDRLRNPQHSGNRKDFNDIAWQDLDNNVINELKNAANSGKEIAIITDAVISPSQRRVLSDFQKAYPTTRVYVQELFNNGTKDEAFQTSYGISKFPLIKWNEANVIVALEDDFLSTGGNSAETSRLYSSRRDVMNGQEFNRLYAVEGNASLTGLNADYRMRLRTDAIEEFVMSLSAEINRRGVTVGGNFGGYNLDGFADKYGMNKESLNQMVTDLMANRGKSIITAGAMLPVSTHIAVNALNDALGNSTMYSFENATDETPVTVPVTQTEGETAGEQTSPVTTPQMNNNNLTVLNKRADLDALVNTLNAGNVGVVIHYGTNPVYTMPTEYNYAEALGKAGTVITMTELVNESSAVSNYTLPVNNYLESWGDFRTRTNYYSLQQPIIKPLYNTRQKEAILLNWLSGNANEYNNDIYHQYVKDNWQNNIYPGLRSSVGFNNFWMASLHDGVVLTENNPARTLNLNSAALGSAGKMTESGQPVVMLKESETMGDGRWANNGWLQELPSSVAKIVWDNYAAVSPATAKQMELKSNDVVKITIDGRSINIPVFVQPGVAEGQFVIELGYGRTVAGTVGTEVGVNANVLMAKSPAITYWLYNNVNVEKTGDTYEIVSTIEHYPIDEEKYKDIQFRRNIIQEGTYSQYKANPEFLSPKLDKLAKENNFPSLAGTEHKYLGVKWAMAVDLNKCTGCGECVIACNVENNIPVVGKEQVGKNREMMWLRVDRYYSGTPEDPRANFQLMLCQHCDMAPCENVCPVKATVHSDDGLNGMTYNRCVGTRYCSNNCPYKVRRFNYFNFRMHFKDNYQEQEPLNMMANPEVTVRSRGVMEKCTFCVQRIMHARQVATQEGRELKGSDVTVACQDACSSDAIVFGDMNDKESVVSKYRDHSLGYNVLDSLKVRPNVTYLAKLRNVEGEVKEVNTH
jgi:MoCo/4Fe-4S cofactor protein with predicted Tat translocation signal